MIDAKIAALNDWRGVPVWEHAGIICTGETYKAVVKMTFAKGAALADPSHLFNASLDGNTRRAIDIREGDKIDIREGDKIDEKALKALIRAAVALNTAKRATARPVRAQKKIQERLSVVKPPSPTSAPALATTDARPYCVMPDAWITGVQRAISLSTSLLSPA